MTIRTPLALALAALLLSACDRAPEAPADAADPSATAGAAPADAAADPEA